MFKIRKKVNQSSLIGRVFKHPKNATKYTIEEKTKDYIHVSFRDSDGEKGTHNIEITIFNEWITKGTYIYV